MRRYLLRAPGWQIAVVTGVPFGLLALATGWFQGAGLTVASITGVCAGLLFGLTTALASRPARREHRHVLDQTSFAEWRVVRRAAWSGPIPDDPRLREHALQLASLQLARSRRWRVPASVVFGLNFLLQVVDVILGERWSILFAAFSVAALVAQYYTLHRLAERVALLQGVST